MSLWIRSQDRELLMKSPEFRYNQKNDNHSILAYDTMGVYRILGTYKTKERALEVFDEITKYKDKLENAWFLGMTESVFISSTYEMPKE